MSNRVTIKQIAVKAGVSPGTVDRVIHNRGNVKPLVKAKIEEVMDELGYQRNIIASALAYNRTFCIAVILPDFRQDVYWEKSKKGIDMAFEAVQHYRVAIDPYYYDLFDPKSFTEQCQKMWENTTLPDAVLFAPQFLKESKLLLKECAEKGIPNVMINTNIPNENALCYIGQDSYQSGVLGGRLLNFGVADGESVLLLNLAKSSNDAQHLIDKERGFRDYFKNEQNNRVEVVKKDFEDFENDKKLKALLTQTLERHPSVTGIFVTTSRAYRVVQCLNEAAIKKVKIVGFDLIEPNLKNLRENRIHFLINQNPVQQGFLGIMNIVKHLILKSPVDKIQHLPLDIVVNENVEYYLNKESQKELLV